MAAYDKADLERRMHGAVEALKHDLTGLRTGRAQLGRRCQLQTPRLRPRSPGRRHVVVADALVSEPRRAQR